MAGIYAPDGSEYVTVVGGSAGLTVGTTALASGTDARVLFQDGTTLGEDSGFTYDKTNDALTLGGATVTTSKPVLNLSQTWNAGAVTFTGLLLNITDTTSASASKFLDLQIAGSSKLSITKAGTILVNGANTNIVSMNFYDTTYGIGIDTSNACIFGPTSQPSLTLKTTSISGTIGLMLWANNEGISLGSAQNFSSSTNAYVRRGGNSTVFFGPTNAASPTAQTLGFQGSRSGTDSNVGGANALINPSIGTGTGTPANLTINGIVGATTGTGAQTVAAVLTSAGVANGQLPSAIIGSAALATNASDGFLYIPTCAGTPTGTPTTATGRIPMIYDTTNHQFWFYDSGWKQPKTPAAAAIITWQ